MVSLCRSICEIAIGKKLIVAISGLLLVGFVVGHLAGNFNMFLGPEAMNKYAKTLEDLGPLLWVIRGGLLFVFLTHVVQAVSLTRKNQAARPQTYVKKTYIKASPASRYMIQTGVLLTAFIAYHLAHFTFRVVQFTGDHFDELGRRNVYEMVIRGFEQPLISITYIIAMIFLALHLSHGVTSTVQSLGLRSSSASDSNGTVGKVFAAVVFLGYVSIPISVWCGFLQVGGP